MNTKRFYRFIFVPFLLVVWGCTATDFDYFISGKSYVNEASRTPSPKKRQLLISNGIAELNQAIKLDPSNPSYHYWLGAAYSLNNHPDQACYEDQVALSLGVHGAQLIQIYQGLPFCFFSHQDFNNSIKYSNIALKYSSSPLARNNLLYILSASYAALGYTDRAESIARKISGQRYSFGLLKIALILEDTNLITEIRGGISLLGINAYYQPGTYVAFVRGVSLGSPGYVGGVRQGDIITKVNNHRVPDNLSDFSKLLASLTPGKSYSFTIHRNGNEFSTNIQPVSIFLYPRMFFNSQIPIDRTALEIISKRAAKRRKNLQFVKKAEIAIHHHNPILAIEEFSNALRSYGSSTQSLIDPYVQTLLKHIFDLTRSMRNLPAPPEDYRKEMLIGLSIVRDSKSTNDYQHAVHHFEQALFIAPYEPAPYEAIGHLYESLKNFKMAVSFYKDYLLAEPGASDAQKLKDHIYILEYKEQNQNAHIP